MKIKFRSPKNILTGNCVKKIGSAFVCNWQYSINEYQKRIKDIKNVGVRWIGPCTVVYERPGKLFDIEYECKSQVLKYLRVHPEFLKLYAGQIV